MRFGEKLQQLRAMKNYTQEDVASEIGISRRAYADYESNKSCPKNRARYEALAKLFGVDIDYLYSENEAFIEKAGNRYGYRGRKQANALVSELAGMFAGGELSDEDKSEVMLDLQRAYWLCKDENRKYTPKKYRKN